MKVSFNISEQSIEDMFVTALEGGSNYWYWLHESEVAKIRKAVPKREEDCLSVALSRAVMKHGVEVEIHDYEDQESLLGVISMDTIEKRLQKLADSNESWALQSMMSDDIDGNVADIIFQYITLGEVVFA